MSEIKVNSVVNSTGDNDSGLDLATNDQVKVKIANAEDFIFKANSLEVQTGSNIDMNGTELILDADGDTSIEASTDDTIVFDTGGSEAMRITAGRHVLIAKTTEGIGTAGFEVQDNGKTLITADGAKCLELNRLTDVGDIFKASTGGNQRIALGGGGGAGYIDGAVGDAGLKFEGAHVRPRDNGSDKDNGITLGNGSFRFSAIFATTGQVSTSDETEKQNIATLSSKEINAGKKLSALFKTFKWRSAVEKRQTKLESIQVLLHKRFKKF